ncbi:2-amino-4-hydroxy-6-hydroxymethyldihydropteridine diphosphokinase [Exiguobacterium aurantiacum]|uniref:2-amino-4-hydroxy-6-hydroxymethyldihydropteridine diphosphokinase n=1 Tax=Exiguobacterium aurantiacum TaxID=33987 RepID=A0ABY5FN56_9BACL|nr:2-amino-4-hydroxy-6-hydroxymethyldihydropteridine diphosphokinase [Exiguobacterium aurantiacum]UTT43017.1 2-amino-4-hydroxy-6-hydroxymethyldihydropteridine diphosphokinase [Exiguobacterium aurantiacum]
MIYVALGSNIGDRARYLAEAIQAMTETGLRVTKESSVYETAPVGYTDQPSFYNMVVELESIAPAEAVLLQLQQIERTLGRERLFKNGPRTIDLDILVYKSEDIQSKQLTVPHPRMHERAFVLAPFAEIAPSIEVKGMTVRALLEALPESERQDVVPLGPLQSLVNSV